MATKLSTTVTGTDSINHLSISSFCSPSPAKIPSPSCRLIGWRHLISVNKHESPANGNRLTIVESSANSLPRAVTRRSILELCISLGLLSGQWGGAAWGMMPVVGLENGRLRSCEGPAPCVSTSAFRSPSRFMPPWQYLGSKEHAYEELLKALKRMGADIVRTDEERYVYATISTSTSREDIDDLEFLFVGKVVCYRSLSRKNSLDPPFCWWPGCINGPKNRGQMEALRDDLGWLPMETDEDKQWTPIFLH